MLSGHRGICLRAQESVPKNLFLRWVNIPSCSADTDADTDDVTFSTSETHMDRFVAVSDPQSADHPQETDQDDPSEADDAGASDGAR